MFSFPGPYSLNTEIATHGDTKVATFLGSPLFMESLSEKVSLWLPKASLVFLSVVTLPCASEPKTRHLFSHFIPVGQQQLV